MFDWLKKPIIWAARQAAGKKRGDAAFKRYEARLEQMYRDLTPDALEVALDTLTDAAGKIIDANRRGSVG